MTQEDFTIKEIALLLLALYKYEPLELIGDEARARARKLIRTFEEEIKTNVR